MRPVLAASLLTSLLAWNGAIGQVRAQDLPRQFPEHQEAHSSKAARADEFQLPVQNSPPFSRPVGSPSHHETANRFQSTWTSGVDAGIQPIPRQLREERPILKVQHTEPASAPDPIPPAMLKAAPFAVPAAMVSAATPPPEIPSSPPVLLLSATSSPSPEPASGGIITAALDDSMIAPPPFESIRAAAPLSEIPPPPMGDIGTDPFVQAACQAPTQNWDRCDSTGFADDCSHLCPTPNPCGAWAPYILGEFLPGNHRVIGGGGLFLPLRQDADSLLFTELRGRGDDRGASDGFFGLGYRQYMDPNWIFGTYVYLDVHKSKWDNTFNQASIGFELLSLDWEFRINGYFPGSEAKSTPMASGYSNGTLVTRGFQERAYRGLDWEIGRRFLHWGWNDRYEVRWFLGSYHFDHSANTFPSFAGPRGRLEMRIHDLGWMGHQSRIEFGVEAAGDRVRDGQVFGFARLHVPFGQNGVRDFLDPLRRRMLDSPVRPLN